MTEKAAQQARSVLERLAAAARTAKPREDDSDQAADFDWTRPCYFTGAEVEVIKAFADDVARRVSSVLSEKLKIELEFAAGPVIQQYQAAVHKPDEKATGFAAYLLDRAGKQCGLVLLPAAYARKWVAGMLGDSEDKQDDQTSLSTLESSLLTDIFAIIVQTISAAVEAAGGKGYSLGEQAAEGLITPPGQSESEFCRIELLQGDSQETPSVSLLVLSEALAGVVRGAAPGPGPSSPEQTGALIQEHLANAPLTATAWIGVATLCMRDILELEPGDVLLIQKRVDEPVDVLVDDKPVLSGLPRTYRGRYAVQVVQSAGVRETEKPRRN